MLDWVRLSDILKRQKKAALLALLEEAFFEMEPEQQQAVFGELLEKAQAAKVEYAAVQEEVALFERDSLSRKYYQSFNINSKNWTHIPEKTRRWFDDMGDLLKDASRLTRQGDHAGAA